MRVRVELFATLRRFGKSFEVECTGDLKDAFLAVAKELRDKGDEFLKEIFDEDGNIRKDRIIMIDGRNIKDELIELREGSRITVFPPIAGG